MTTLWQYRAVVMPGGDGVASARAATRVERGELAADSASDARASLRRLGLRVLEVRELRPSAGGAEGWRGAVAARWHRYLAARRGALKAEAFDAIATLLDAGLAVTDATRTLGVGVGRARSLRLMLARLNEDLKGGHGFPEAMARQPAWFDAIEVAMVRAGEHGELARTLRGLGERHARAGELTARLIGALAYPCVVLVVGIGVAMFLSTRTLPQLVGILEQARVPTPGLTRAVMAVGQGLVDGWAWILAVCAAALGLGLTLRFGRRVKVPEISWMRRWAPRVAREVVLARALLGLSELVRSGVPMTDSLRLVAASAPPAGVVGGSLRSQLEGAAARIERGEEPSSAMDDSYWFDAELRQMVRVGEASGELPSMLQRLGERYERVARRSIDRLVAVLEPSVVLLLAAVVGVIVMAAVLPMLRLQEVIR